MSSKSVRAEVCPSLYGMYVEHHWGHFDTMEISHSFRSAVKRRFVVSGNTTIKAPMDSSSSSTATITNESKKPEKNSMGSFRGRTCPLYLSSLSLTSRICQVGLYRCAAGLCLTVVSPILIRCYETLGDHRKTRYERTSRKAQMVHSIGVCGDRRRAHRSHARNGQSR